MYLCLLSFAWLPHCCSFPELGPMTQIDLSASLLLHLNSMTERTNRIGDLSRHRVSWGSPLMVPLTRVHMLSIDYQNYQIQKIKVINKTGHPAAYWTRDLIEKQKVCADHNFCVRKITQLVLTPAHLQWLQHSLSQYPQGMSEATSRSTFSRQQRPKDPNILQRDIHLIEIKNCEDTRPQINWAPLRNSTKASAHCQKYYSDPCCQCTFYEMRPSEERDTDRNDSNLAISYLLISMHNNSENFACQMQS